MRRRGPDADVAAAAAQNLRAATLELGGKSPQVVFPDADLQAAANGLVAGVFAAQQIKPQARTLAVDRGIRCLTLDYDALRGAEVDEFRLF